MGCTTRGRGYTNSSNCPSSFRTQLHEWLQRINWKIVSLLFVFLLINGWYIYTNLCNDTNIPNYEQYYLLNAKMLFFHKYVYENVDSNATINTLQCSSLIELFILITPMKCFIIIMTRDFLVITLSNNLKLECPYLKLAKPKCCVNVCIKKLVVLGRQFTISTSRPWYAGVCLSLVWIRGL